MPYRLKGTLKAPNGQPLTGVDLQFIAQQTLSPVLQQTDHNIRLGVDGSYDVSLEFNTYAVKAQIGGLAPQHMGYISVNADTPAGLDLPQLLRLYSQEATAPDYAKMIEEWLKEAKAAADTATAQATSAKAQADHAKAEADRASQITGLDTVADAIGLAAVPFPDVWIPFNDSLRMLAGFGRDVKVGADVVATYVNYERATTATYTDKSGAHRTAAINEPRFEKQGLLIEGQSTNLILRSNTHTSVSKFIDTGETTESPIDGEAVRVLAISGGEVANNYIRFNNTVMGSVSTPRTSSCWVKSIGSDISISIDCDDVDAVTVTCRADTWTRISATRKTPLSNKYVGFFDISIPNAVGGQKISVWGAQLEDSPFASSYIPTTGAAVTRASDVVKIPRLNNECAEWYCGADRITPKINADTIEFLLPASKRHIRNLKGFFTPLTEAQKKGLK